MERVDWAPRSSAWRSLPVGDCTAAFAIVRVIAVMSCKFTPVLFEKVFQPRAMAPRRDRRTAPVCHVALVKRGL